MEEISVESLSEAYWDEVKEFVMTDQVGSAQSRK